MLTNKCLRALRVCSQHQNTLNKSKANNTSSDYLGVSWRKQNLKWQAQISFNYKKINLGSYNTEIEAAIIYNNKAKELFGEFANLNII